MVKKLFAKLTSLVLVVMLALTMVPSGLAFAAGESFELALSADKYSLNAGETVVVTVTMNGEFKDISSLQIGVLYDPTAVSVDLKNTGTSRKPRYDNAIEANWYAANDPYEYTGICEAFDLGIGSKIYKLDNTKNVCTILFTSQDGLTIDSNCSLYGETSVEVFKVIFKANKAIDSVADVFAIGTDKESTDIGVNGTPVTFTVANIAKIDMAAVNNVNALISAIPATVTYADKAKVEAAKTAYTALGDAEKALVTGAEKITSAETAIAAMETAISNVETLIAAIGEVIYPDSKDKIDAARSAYDALADDAQKAAVDNYTALTEAEADYAALEQGALEEAANRAAAAAVDAKIEAIGTVAYTVASKALIDDADAAYKALTSAQTVFVTKKAVLDSAIATYKALDDEVVAVNNALSALDASAVKLTDKASLAELRQQYADLDDNQEAAILPANLEKLVACEAKIVELEARKARIDAVITKIDAIGNVELTTECKALIDAAREAFDALSDDSERNEVTNKAVLETAEADYKALEDAAAENEANMQAAAAVDAKIAAIGTVVYTSASKALIDDAKAAYQALTPAQQALVSKKAELDDKDKQYSVKHNRVKSIERKLINIGSIEKVTIEDGLIISDLEEWLADLPADEIAALDRFCNEFAEGISTFADTVAELRTVYNAILAKVENVKALIAGLGTVTLESGDAIVEAENAYKALTNDEKEYVTNYATLTKAREDYNTLVTYKEAADEVVDAICALPSAASVTKDNVDTVVAKIASAKASYENLPDKTMVADKYLEMLADVEEACNVVKADVAAAKAVDDLIAAIGTVSLESLNKIETAEAAYDELSDMAQSYVTKKDVLDSARATYDELKADQEAIDAVEDLIAAIGDVTLGSLADIEAAEEAFEALDDTLKTRVESYSTLVAARAKYNELLASKGKVDAVIAQIEAIGTVTLGSLAKIQAAEAGYEALTDEEKGSVDNYQTLLDARAAYDELKAAADKEETDREAALGVDELIAALAPVTLESEADVLAARAAYEALTDDQKAYVANLNALEEAEAILEGLKADKAAVDAVIEAINAIGEVTYPDSKDAIDAAQAAYDDLADNLKAQVTNKGVLDNAIAKYAGLEADYNAVQAVIELIEAIGDVEYTVDCKERIDAADEAYLALKDELRADVTNADVLEAAKAKYEELKPAFTQTKEPVSEYGDMYMTVFSNIPEDKKVTLGGVEALMYKENNAVYYLVLSSTVINPEEVVVEDGSSASILMGDTNGDGTVDALDAFATNNKSANHAVDAYITDAMAYVRSDINGSGTITAYDALMIARIAAGVQGVVINFAAVRDEGVR